MTKATISTNARIVDIGNLLDGDTPGFRATTEAGLLTVLGLTRDNVSEIASKKLFFCDVEITITIEAIYREGGAK